MSLCAFQSVCAIDLIANGIPSCLDSQPDDPAHVADPGNGIENTNPHNSLPPAPIGCTTMPASYSALAALPKPVTNICYTGGVPNAPAPGYSFVDPTEGSTARYLTFDFWAADVSNAPLLVYFHPNGVTKSLTVGGDIYNNVVLPALTAHFAVASVEFRHPVVDDFLFDHKSDGSTGPGLGYLPSNDTGYAVQFMRAHSVKLGVDPNNVFSVGYSRGSLSLWQALQPDLKTSSYNFSSIPNGFYGYQAQTTYKCAEFATWFVTSSNANNNGHNDQADSLSECQTKYTGASGTLYYPMFTSAVDSLISSTRLPIMIRYRDAFYTNAAHNPPDAAIKLNTLWSIQNYDYQNDQVTPDGTDHYPDMGVELYQTYRSLLQPSGIVADVDIDQCRANVTDGFAELITFIQNHIN